MNVLNPALTARAFIFFAYPAQMSGDAVWAAVDGFTKATPLAIVAGAPRGASAMNALTEAGYTFTDMFIGFIPGSIGETIPNEKTSRPCSIFIRKFPPNMTHISWAPRSKHNHNADKGHGDEKMAMHGVRLYP